VTTSSGLNGVPIAQFVTCTLLMLVHRLPQLREFQWSQRSAGLASVIRGQTAGILGYGSIGRECARQLHALGMRIMCLDAAGRRDEGYTVWPETGDPEGTLPERWFKPGDLHEMLPLCDVLVVAVPFTPQTSGMLGQAEIALMKRTARIVIISRGGIVQEAPLAAALAEGRLAGAVVDCFVQEPPPPDHPFLSLPNLIATPHIAGAYEGFWPAMIRLLAGNLRRFQAGQPLHNQVNKKLGY
jgi:phosphoglycerate dehydrogenase-like enzyme